MESIHDRQREDVRHDVEPGLLLVHYIRDVLQLTGTHVGCDTSQCGACTIIMDGAAVRRSLHDPGGPGGRR